jgi:hypothetical protein
MAQAHSTPEPTQPKAAPHPQAPRQHLAAPPASPGAFVADRTTRPRRARCAAALWTLQDFGGKQPSEIFREHFLTCFISDPTGVKLRHDIGIDNTCWEVYYPHSDSNVAQRP